MFSLGSARTGPKHGIRPNSGTAYLATIKLSGRHRLESDHTVWRSRCSVNQGGIPTKGRPQWPIVTIILALALGFAAVAQEEAAESGSSDIESVADDAPDEVTAAEDEDEDEEVDDSDLDEQTYEEDEDDFIPSEEIPADQPIPFPSNI